MKLPGFAATLLASAALACCLPAQATPFTLNFEGVVTDANFDPFDPLGGAVHAGSTLYSYLNSDSAAADAAAGPNLGSYTVSGGTYGFAGVIDGIVFPVMRTVNISVFDGPLGGPDQYTVFASEGVQDGLSDYFSLSILLQDDSGTAITGDALPTTLPDSARFGTRTFNFFGQYTNVDGVFVQYEVQGLITPATPVSSPGTLALLAAAGAAAALARGRRSGSPQLR